MTRIVKSRKDLRLVNDELWDERDAAVRVAQQMTAERDAAVSLAEQWKAVARMLRESNTQTARDAYDVLVVAERDQWSDDNGDEVFLTQEELLSDTVREHIEGEQARRYNEAP